MGVVVTNVSPSIQVQHCRPELMVSVLVLSDMLSLSVAGAVALLPKWSIEGFHVAASYIVLIPFLSLFLLAFWSLGFYSGVSLSSPEELRRCTLACSLVSLCVAVSTISLRESHILFTWSMLAAFLLAVVAVPVAREFVRFRYCKANWWGYPTVVFGDEKSGTRLIRVLTQQLDLGLKPMAFVCSGASAQSHVCGVPIIDESDIYHWEPCLQRQGYALLTGMPDSPERIMNLIAENRAAFPHILVIPETWEFSSLWVSPKNVGGFLGLEVKEPLFQPSKRALKRVFDFCLTVFLLTLSAPVFLAISVAIRMDSSGPVFYAQRRIGRGGKEFNAWKFRSMRPDAEALLATYLAENPAMAVEWEQNHKLRFDPRTTRIGRFLRSTSLDELPQLWNVLRGDMSLVGPRPIVRAEIHRYGRHFGLYTRVQGGLTGLWQVSGRSSTSYDERVQFDAFYARNWSIWLDLCILFRTIGVLLVRAGAY